MVPTEILVYTLRSDSWKTIETDLSRCFNTGNTDGVLVNGVLHWFGATSNTFFNFILAFNIGNEKLIHVPLPEGITPLAPQVYKSVGLWEGCLSLVDVIMDCGRTDVWVMQNYSVTESWTKKFTISQYTITMLCYPKLIWSHKDGQILIRTGDAFVLFNPANERVRKILVTFLFGCTTGFPVVTLGGRPNWLFHYVKALGIG
ncbi:F-box protein CPR1-like [Papaver somniferum]|uniref:F-box protein CPR1-like n=1 Tax=Papaver somniferum TaxID=3469 RepID=UPI000E7060D6|nr:F-box protein CPR1-like [Papaver somniferum]